VVAQREMKCGVRLGLTLEGEQLWQVWEAEVRCGSILSKKGDFCD